ncbi:hypothetical protein F4810DRAFT_695601 [Camillea tinctor]|nr:hypothetical protein F4810DRAFT_695601 [Camillea tinctor]
MDCHSTTTNAPLSPIKRYVTGHDPASGKSIYLDVPDLQFNPIPIPGFGSASRSYATTTLPPELGDDVDLKEYLSRDSAASLTRQEIIVPPTELNSRAGETMLGGMNVVNLAFEPAAVGHMHRTVSLDISTCVSGEVYHELDSGEKVLLKPGDHIIQRGTMHRWINASKVLPARVLAVLLPCESFKVGDKFIEEEHIFN